MTNLGTSGWLYFAVVVIAAFALVILLAGVMRFRRRQLVRGSVQCLGGVSIGLVALVVLLIGVNLLAWQRFTHERPVAELSFQQLGPQYFAVRIDFADGHERRARLHGDQWQLDARVLKWDSIATVLGFNPLYRLERLHGRYASVRQARKATPSVVGFGEPHGLSLWQLAHNKVGWLPFIDASYGSATYLPMADQARYQVTISNTGLLARPANDAAYRATRAWQ